MTDETSKHKEKKMDIDDLDALEKESDPETALLQRLSLPQRNKLLQKEQALQSIEDMAVVHIPTQVVSKSTTHLQEKKEEKEEMDIASFSPESKEEKEKSLMLEDVISARNIEKTERFTDVSVLERETVDFEMSIAEDIVLSPELKSDGIFAPKERAKTVHSHQGGTYGAMIAYCEALTLNAKCVDTFCDLGDEFCRLSDYYYLINKVRMIPLLGYFVSPDYHYPEALLSYEAALEIDPGHLPASIGRNRIIKALGKAATVPLKLKALRQIKESDGPIKQFVSKLKVVNFSGCSLTFEQVHNLAQVLKINPSLTTVRLDRSHLTDKGLTLLVEALAENSTVTTLTFSENSLLTSASDSSKKKIRAYLHRNQLLSLEQITTSDLRNLDLTVLKPVDLHNILTRHSNLTRLDFSGKDITVDTILLQSKSWSIYPALTHLNLSNNQLSDEGAKQLAALLKSEPCLFPSLSVLDASHNQMHDQGFRELVPALLKIKTLKVCILDGNCLSYIGFRDFLRDIRHHPQLERLSLRENRIYQVDKATLDHDVGELLREQEHVLQQIDVTGNYLMSQGHDRNRLTTLRLLLRATGLSVEEFTHAQWVREKDSMRPHHTVLCLIVDDKERDFEVPLSVMDAFNTYRTAQSLGSDKRVIEDLQKGLIHNLRHRPALKAIRLSTMDAKAVKEQKQLCKQMLFYHPHAPLKAYLQSHPVLRTEPLSQVSCLLYSNQTVTPQAWYVYFLVKKTRDPRREHAMIGWEGVYNYGQRAIKIAHLTVERGQGLLSRDQLVISYFPLEIERIDSFRQHYVWAVFPASKQRIKDIEVVIDRESTSGVPGKYKMILSGSSGLSTLSPEKQKELQTNCQKWALEKLEACLDLSPQTLQMHMSPLPSTTAKTLQALPQAVATEQSSLPDVKGLREERESCLVM